jgi:hypothetical protein
LDVAARIIREICQSDFGEVVFVGVADYCGHAGEAGDFFGGALSVASGDDDSCRGVLAADAADGGAGILIGGTCDGASIQNHQVGLAGRCAGQTAGFELAFEGGAVGLSGAASEVFDVEGGHEDIVAPPGDFFCPFGAGAAFRFGPGVAGMLRLPRT